MRKIMRCLKTMLFFALLLLVLGACLHQPLIRREVGASVGLSTSAQPVPIPATARALRQELSSRIDKAQAIRARLTGTQPDQVLIHQEMQIDAENIAWLKQVVAKFGWPGKSLVGVDGAANAWLLVQLADQDIAFQKECLQLMAALLESGEISKQHYAYLYDRVAIGEARPQRYGTLGMCTASHTWEPILLEEPTKVDQLRQSVELESLEAYRKSINSTCP